MGQLIRFYEHWNQHRRPVIRQPESAMVIVLPVVNYRLLEQAERRRRPRKRVTLAKTSRPAQ